MTRANIMGLTQKKENQYNHLKVSSFMMYSKANMSHFLFYACILSLLKYISYKF